MPPALAAALQRRMSQRGGGGAPTGPPENAGGMPGAIPPHLDLGQNMGLPPGMPTPPPGNALGKAPGSGFGFMARKPAQTPAPGGLAELLKAKGKVSLAPLNTGPAGNMLTAMKRRQQGNGAKKLPLGLGKMSTPNPGNGPKSY